MKTLKDVKVGETATVARLHGEGPVKRRIMDTLPVILRIMTVSPALAIVSGIIFSPPSPFG